MIIAIAALGGSQPLVIGGDDHIRRQHIGRNPQAGSGYDPHNVKHLQRGKLTGATPAPGCPSGCSG